VSSRDAPSAHTSPARTPSDAIPSARPSVTGRHRRSAPI
jgi:hypothetical protein